MPLLLDLSPEIVSSILDHVAPDSQSLDALCLTGNHNLLALTRPYTLIEVSMVLGAESQASGRTAERFTAFFADPVKPKAIRSLKITLIGPYIHEMPAIRVLRENLKLLVNVTHFSLCCTRSRNLLGFSTPAWLVRAVVERFPSLVSIEVTGCNAVLEREFEDMKDSREEAEPPLPDPKLSRVSTRFCHSNLGDIWAQCPNVRSLEMEGGNAEEFWRRTVAQDEMKPTTKQSTKEERVIAESLSQFHGLACTYEIINTIERLNIKADTAPENARFHPDVNRLSDLFAEPEDPPENLKDLVISLNFDVDMYRRMLYAMRGPTIERIAMVLACKKNWADAEFDELLLEIKNDAQGNAQLLFFAKFESLCELFLPCGSLSTPSTDLLVDLLSHAPALRHLFFDTAENCDLPAAAQKYALAIATLESVSWKDQATFGVKRWNGVEVVRRAYNPPAWTEWRGVGKWWEL
ncbi:hypothetical protein DFH06DRAFT_1121499 [Mycena polygramma]|nr:hypothetical protein DFH06DRAFT_1121499 [Mycena polygramma]